MPGWSGPWRGRRSSAASRSLQRTKVMTEEQLATLVDRFYAKVRADKVLGPVFNGAVHDWPEHLAKLSAFWSSVMLTTGRYKGNPMVAHAQHKGSIEPAMFGRWLELWRETAGEV